MDVEQEKAATGAPQDTDTVVTEENKQDPAQVTLNYTNCTHTGN